MRKIKYYLLTTIFLLSSITTAASTDEATNSVVMVKRGQTEFVISLKANPTTGYTWFLQQYDNNLISLLSHHYKASATTLVGAGGIEEWHFKLMPNAKIAPVTTDVKFSYARPWEIQQGKATIITIVVQ